MFTLFPLPVRTKGRIWTSAPKNILQLLCFMCPHSNCTKTFDTPLELAVHFRDNHEEEELDKFASTVAALDYERFRLQQMNRMQQHMERILLFIHLRKVAVHPPFPGEGPVGC